MEVEVAVCLFSPLDNRDNAVIIPYYASIRNVTLMSHSVMAQYGATHALKQTFLQSSFMYSVKSTNILEQGIMV